MAIVLSICTTVRSVFGPTVDRIFRPRGNRTHTVTNAGATVTNGGVDVTYTA